MRLRTISRKMKQSVHGKPGTRGHAMVEVALMAPWIFLLFIGILDFGFYAYSAISVENAARAAALYTSSSGGITDSAGACFYVLQELRNVANVGTSVTTCGTGSTTPSQTAPVVVTAQAATVGGVPAAQVTVTYQMVPLIPIPWLPIQNGGLYNITRTVSMRQAQ